MLRAARIVEACLLVAIVGATVRLEALPQLADRQQEPASGRHNSQPEPEPEQGRQAAARPKCPSRPDQLDDCKEERAALGQLPAGLARCLSSCAHCVKQWRSGVYDGRSCARDCVQRQAEHLESLDPDCSLIKYFNPTVIASVV